ncbi:MAG: sodium:solute symporter family protein [Planctomycetota bacterium]|jgi:Na+/proline symporter
MHFIDSGIIIVYLTVIVVSGLMLSRKASLNLDSYFLGGKTVPWYLLGASNASSMFDIAGTMYLVTLLFVYGLKSAWLPWLWPTFNTVFMAAYLSVWLRRSNAMTGSEWIRTRFGDKLGAELAQISVAIFALIWTVAFMAYAFQGIGKFAAVFLPWDLHPNVYAIIIMGFTALYVIFGGMYSVVVTDLIQFTIMIICSIIVAIIAMNKVSPEALNAVIPDGWKNVFFGWEMNIDWSTLIPQVNEVIKDHAYSPFGFFFIMMMFKGLIGSLAGPAPNYDMQRILATRSAKEAAGMSAFTSAVLFFPRYLLITGITILGLVFFSEDLLAMGDKVDFEQVFPYVINNFIPPGLFGFLIAGLLAAFMSTFSSTINAGAAYAANDIYKRYINPNASSKKYVHVGYICSLGLVITGIVAGLMASSIDQMLQWIVAGLTGGYIAPNILKWYWWRLNGVGYFGGMIIGMSVSLILPVALPGLHPLYGFPIILVLSLAGTVVASLMSKPDDEQVTKNFYKNVRPWGLWKPVHAKVIAEDPAFKKNSNFRRDMFNIAVGIIWQLTFTVIPIFLVIREFKPMWITVAVLLVTTGVLKKTWYDKLKEE